MSFEDFYVKNELLTYNKTEYECMKMAWNAAINEAKDVLWDYHKNDSVLDILLSEEIE